MTKTYFSFIGAVFLALISISCGGSLSQNTVADPGDGQVVRSTPGPEPVFDAELERRIRETAENTKGKLGVFATVLETGQTVGIRQNDRFGMQSVVKLPIAMAVLKMVDDGELKLDAKIKVSKDELVPAGMHSPFRDENPEGGEATVEELLWSAVSVSDGTAADVLQRVAGGAAGVQKFIDGLGIEGAKVKYTHKEFSDDSQRQFENWMSPEAAGSLLKALYDAVNTKNAAIDARPRALSSESASLLMKMMTETSNPASRIIAGLPEGTVAAHKTGSSGTRDGITAATNDVGIITLPNGNHLILAVFLADSPDEQETRDGAIATITKAVWDAWSAA